MNQIFSFKRYVWLLKRQWYENAAGYKRDIALMTLLVCSMFWLLFWIFGKFRISDNQSDIFKVAQMATFVITGILFVFMYGVRFFNSLTSKSRKMFYFSLPVSPLERVTIAFTFVSVLVPLLFWIVFTIFDCLSVQLFNSINETSVQMFFKVEDFQNKVVKETTLGHYMFYLSFVSIFTFGSLMFGKKGLVISILIIIAFVIIYFWLWKWLMVFGICSSTYMKLNISTDPDLFDYLIPVWWVMMYFAMKRKEA